MYNSTNRQFFRTYWSLTVVPRDIPAEALEVDLQHNALSFIPAGVFSHLTKCVHLDLSYNGIASVDKEGFNGLSSLQTLKLHNKISTLEPGTFDHLTSCNILILNQNKLVTLNPDLFINLPRLPLQLLLTLKSFDTNHWDCSSLCWLKHEEQQGTVTWLYGRVPKCADEEDWQTLQCGDPGQDRILQFSMRNWLLMVTSIILLFSLAQRCWWKMFQVDDCHTDSYFQAGVCSEPGGVKFATRSWYNGPYNPGDQVTHTCFTGESGTITCQSDGTWPSRIFCRGKTWQPWFASSFVLFQPWSYFQAFSHFVGKDVCQISWVTIAATCMSSALCTHKLSQFQKHQSMS